ncbi:hypothetical protein AD945_03840 [Gluconobacter albidus]|uniref:Uncharacterized protein n=1 Tax=Gluconobacter albidus TaxID=318683 RepID=A0A149TLL2_9PROT|nr:hypothetical protein [Gluconobacter albidus]KXV49672.1 hypothetical protein AD945_03840 [Gluconobacter albidus]
MRISFHFLSLRLSRVEHRLICWTIQQVEIRERIDPPSRARWSAMAYALPPVELQPGNPQAAPSQGAQRR